MNYNISLEEILKTEDTRKYINIKEMLAGNHFGEISLLSNLSVTTTVHAVSNSVL
jgi:CRP-like cAMP-binding protein